MTSCAWPAPPLARRLAAPQPTWIRSADVVVVGSGVAGLTVALGASRGGKRVVLLTKDELGEGSTCWAQGGVAAALAPGDSPRRHLRDTLEAGAGLCDRTAARTLVERGGQAVRRLARYGASFDTAAGGGYTLTREGGHMVPRIVHAGGDATGREVQRTLQAAVREAPGVEVVEHAFALDLLRGAGGAAAGATVGMLEPGGAARGAGVVRAPAVVLATGGFGQLYATTTNPDVATGDGLALALRAGAEVTDVEFVQFHPTVLFATQPGHRLLISEALRGEGATLVDATGESVMAGVHPLADLAPRDVVARAIARRMALAPGGVSDHVLLDARGLGGETLARRFPTILAGCRAAGVDPATEPIPVAPAAHYSCGGVRVDTTGRTTVPGLFAVGEVACTGVHGANRLASNSLLEGLVMGDTLAGELTRSPLGEPPLAPVGTAASSAQVDTSGSSCGLVPAGARGELTDAMWRYAGVLRTPAGLATAAELLRRVTRGGEGPDSSAPLPPAASGVAASRASWEATNLHAVATVLVAAARARQESRGCHVREDAPERHPEWRRHLVGRVEPDGSLRWRLTAGTRLDAERAPAA